MDERKRIIVKVRIDGLVQGVWYRGWTVEQAAMRQLHGWVRNRPDGSVEALFCGDPGMVQQMIEACYQGPPAARVSTITCETVELVVEPGFRQLPTG